MKLARLLAILIVSTGALAFQACSPKLSPVGPGWANNSVNAVIFRKNSIASHQGIQYTAYYDAEGYVVLAKRQLPSGDWTVRKTGYTGNVRDAHNSISIIVDGNGILHMSWDHHGDQLNYCRSIAPGSLELTAKQTMIGANESDVTYPEFYNIANGDLMFFYRDGESGRGNLIINRYDHRAQTWSRVQNKLIDGEDQRNAYIQASVDPNSETIHLSWVWRETWDVSTNHDLSYAVSRDGGKSWQTSAGVSYQLPITIENAEIAWEIPQNSELINQTSMCADLNGHPYIASYWTPKGETVPQYHIVFHDGESWRASQVSDRKTPFSLSGGGTKRIPISRPQILADSSGQNNKAYLIFRDEERSKRPSIAICDDLSSPSWVVEDLADIDLGQWEPSYDIGLWHREKVLHLFVQRVDQGDGETSGEIPPQMVSVLRWSD
ncbi:BNR repeat-containing protein [Pelagicoccus sp. SDUM812003]|uniref:BNR repeat-containing protein n=1 Tax=Pelagicoccus sp. SDUM812003 TaxID=3041267 RepID=UPI00280D224A|nr:BNR repeat-containing protein [Pelagicoccus sp. SDUM812003]MDQ8205066.1 BNR repeat-containing protein [Pelagicoccus sp. SDUM812003]